MNRKFQEIRLSILLNKIDKLPINEYNVVIKLLNCLAEVFGSEYVDAFHIMLSNSINNNILGASDKEIIASLMQLDKSPTEMSKFLGMYYQKFTIRFSKYLNNDNLLNEFTQEDEKTYFDPKYYVLWNLMYKLLTKFKYPLGNRNHDLRNHKRSMELEFYLIYAKLSEFITNETLIGKFIFNVCNCFNIDNNSINVLKNGLIYITRTLPHFSMNGRYFKQEIVTLCMNKGIKKGTIGSQIFNKGTRYLYHKNTKVFANVIRKEDMVWQYITTVNWEYIQPEEVLKFIDLFHDFIRLEY